MISNLCFPLLLLSCIISQYNFTQPPLIILSIRVQSCATVYAAIAYGAVQESRDVHCICMSVAAGCASPTQWKLLTRAVVFAGNDLEWESS